ncbi:tetratricopeptide repeat protein [Aquimarina sp. 2201CG5-10]|uniref:tetratricopeptide repeat-containing sensor histidine kinase n=1 Tax=Aquimarina callyspongiae TaxID=3098150 RepID=UPI002AB32E99|nr:tetratricopeptide repeat protein [Aquimarina sp. 2201CG5-10]MDY8136188.1 tetratricopeptide repeat protein [Aquimarina sp. 2201CG5-10]
MKKIYLALVCVFINTPIYIYAQENLQETTQVEQDLKRSKELIQKNLDSSLYYSDSALQLSKRLANDTLIAKSYLQKSSALIYKKKFSDADSLLQNNLSKKLPVHIEGQTLHNLATIQYYKQDFKKALDIYLKAAKVLEKARNSKQLVNTYANIGSINASLKNFDNARIYLERALPLSDFNEILRLQILVNLCNIYFEQKLFKQYKNNIFEAEKLAIKYKAKNALSVIYTNLSIYFAVEGADYDRAITYGEKAILLKKELNFIQTLDVTYNNLGHSYLKKKEYRKAITYLDSALPTSQGMLKSYVYNNLKESYLGLNNYKKALSYAELKDQVKDSINDKKQKEQVAELTEKFESEKKQQQIDILDTENKLQQLTINQQNYLLLIISAFVILIIVISYFGFKSYKTKQKLNTVLLQQKLRKTQLNPHFLFNALQSIQNFIYQNEKEKSASYLASYSKLIRLVLEKSDDHFINVAEDKLALESYLNLQQLNHNNSFSYTIDVQDDIDEDFEMLPTLITQPFVENAVLHGLKGITGGTIIIKYYKENTSLCVSISDNGKGFEIKNQESKTLHKSMSMNIIEEQLKNLNKTSGGFQGDISIHSSSSGTKIVLRFTDTPK